MTRTQRAKRPAPAFRRAPELDRQPGIRSFPSGTRSTELHEVRLDAVMRALLDSGVSSVLDLGCGEGELLVRLAQHPRFKRVLGVDISPEALEEARRILRFACTSPQKRIELALASFTSANAELKGFDAGVLLETIEHVDPHRLPLVESAVFCCYRPRHIIITTPNREYNVLHGMRPGALRHPDHRFEWDRRYFQKWSGAIAARNGYAVAFHDIGPVDAALGASTQMAVFKLIQVPTDPELP